MLKCQDFISCRIGTNGEIKSLSNASETYEDAYPEWNPEAKGTSCHPLVPCNFSPPMCLLSCIYHITMKSSH